MKGCNMSIEFPSKIMAYLEANEDYAQEMFKIAKQHRMIYMTLNEKAMELYKPVIEFFEEQKEYDEAIKYVTKNCPDCIERVFVINRLLDLKEGIDSIIKI